MKRMLAALLAAGLLLLGCGSSSPTAPDPVAGTQPDSGGSPGTGTAGEGAPPST